MRTLSRRSFIGLGLTAAVGLGVGAPLRFGVNGSASTGNVLPSRRPLPPRFTQPLVLPPMLTPVHSDSAGDHYEITQTQTMVPIFPDVPTAMWTYNGSFPGPTIVSRRGRPTHVTHTNRLPVPTVVHLHGGHTPPDSDGYPTDYIYPVGSSATSWLCTFDATAMRGNTRVGCRTYTYPMEQRAATLWYHDHRMDFTGPSVWRGLAGFHLVRDDEEDALGLPSGARELLLMIADRSFDMDGALLYPSIDTTLTGAAGVTSAFSAGVLSDVMLVNGVPWPVSHVAGTAYRLRILNACNARRLDLRLDPQPDALLTQIGTDGGLLPTPIHHQHVELAPAQRLDVLVDFSSYAPGTTVTLLNDFGEGAMDAVMQFIVGERTGDRFSVPERLSTDERLSADHAVATRTFRVQSGNVNHMQSWLMNDQPFNPNVIAATVTRGTVEVWHFITDFHHPMHLHLNPFQVLARGTSGPGPFDAGWKDTIDLRPAEAAAIAIRFDGYTGKYVFHCHNLEHEDMAMMANFMVL